MVLTQHALDYMPCNTWKHMLQTWFVMGWMTLLFHWIWLIHRNLHGAWLWDCFTCIGDKNNLNCKIYSEACVHMTCDGKLNPITASFFLSFLFQQQSLILATSWIDSLVQSSSPEDESSSSTMRGEDTFNLQISAFCHDKLKTCKPTA